MLDTPNWSVKPTAHSARIADVTSPKPIARVSWFMRSGPCSSSPLFSRSASCRSGVQGRAGDDQDGGHRLAGCVVVVIGEGPLGAVVLVEGERAACPNVLDLLAGLELLESLPVAVDLDGAWRGGGHLDDELVVGGRSGGMGLGHGQRGDVDRVIVGDRVRVLVV